MGSLPSPSEIGQPTLYLIRHGQAEHNVPPHPVNNRDTLLTGLGQTQARSLQTAFSSPSRQRITTVVASPLRRALYTALIGFEDLVYPAGDISSPRKVVALPEAQEFSDAPCDTGLPARDLIEEFESPGVRWEGCVDLDLLPEEWGSPKIGKWAPEDRAVEKRAREARRWLREIMKGRQEDCVLVTHGHFLHVVTEDWSDFDRTAGTGWKNAEVRAYHFVDGLHSTTDENASIKETEHSRKSRLHVGLMGHSSSQESEPASTAIVSD